MSWGKHVLGVPAAQLVGRRSWRRGQTAGGGSIPRWSTGKPQVVTRRKATGAGQKKWGKHVLRGVKNNKTSTNVKWLEKRKNKIKNGEAAATLFIIPFQIHCFLTTADHLEVVCSRGGNVRCSELSSSTEPV